MKQRALLVIPADHESVVSAALRASGLEVQTAVGPALAPLLAQADLLIIDPARLHAFGLGLDSAMTAIRLHRPELPVVVYCSERERPNPLLVNWNQQLGYLGTFGRVSPIAFAESAQPMLEVIAQTLGLAWDPERLTHYARAFTGTLPQVEKNIYSELGNDAVDDLAKIIVEDCLALNNRRWRLKSYPDCFVGMDAASAMAQRLLVDRPSAVALGQRLLERGWIYHVSGEQPFRDGNFFYRIHRSSERLAPLSLSGAEAALRQNVAVADRSWRGLSFAQCFIGTDAQAVLTAQFALDYAEAVSIGQALLQAHVFRHVADAHDYFGNQWFYRFAPAGRAA